MSDETEISGRVEKRVNGGSLSSALDLAYEALQSNGGGEALLRAASKAWLAAADESGTLEAFGAEKADRLQHILIIQHHCDASLPIFAHHIAARHSSGVAGQLDRAARHLEHTLTVLLTGKEPDPNAVVLALLLRSSLPSKLQHRISDLHKSYFVRFSEGQLRIPYSEVFDRRRVSRNLADLNELVERKGESLVDGSVSLVHLLLLFWLVPTAFESLCSGWHRRAIDARRLRNLTDGEEGAARSLRMRFGGGEGPEEIALAIALASERNLALAACRGGSAQAVKRLESRTWQVAAVARNHSAALISLFSQRRRRPRVALCISGQLRGYRSAWSTWSPLLANADVTTFVHTWKKIGRGTPEPFRYVQPFEGKNFGRVYRLVGTDLGLVELRCRYPSLFAELGASGETSQEELSAFYGTPHVIVEDEQDSRFANFGNPDKMYWKAERCYQLMVESGEEFDAIIRIRPDKPISAVGFSWPDMIEALHSRPLLFCETALGVHYGALLMGDQFAVGLPFISGLYAQTYTRMQGLMNLGLHKLEPVLSGHSSFAQACWLSGIDVRKVPIKFGPFQEAEPMPVTAIRDALRRDTAGRLDEIDRKFIAAVEADLN